MMVSSAVAVPDPVALVENRRAKEGELRIHRHGREMVGKAQRGEVWPNRSVSRNGAEMPPRYSNRRMPSGKSHSWFATSAVNTDKRKPPGCPEASTTVITPYRATVSDRVESRTPSAPC